MKNDVTESASPPSDSEAEDDHLGNPMELDEISEPPPSPPPYQFHSADVGPAARRLDAAYAIADPMGRWPRVIDSVRGGPPSQESLVEDTSLDRALQTLVLFSLQLAPARKAPGCRLGPQTETDSYAYPARIREVPEPEIQLWRELADVVEQPAASARLHDLLAERRDGDVRAHAEAAVDAYMDILQEATGDVGVRLSHVEVLVRAWDICRRYRLWSRHQRIQVALLDAAARELQTGAHTPGIVCLS